MPPTILLALAALAQAGADNPPYAEYFRAETARIAARSLAGVSSAEEWKRRRPELQGKLKGMLGLDPEPPRGDLRVEVRGTVERPDFAVEKILFQSAPGLYVTANVYRPKNPDGRLPAILYVCGHSRVEKDGVIYGNKTFYQHHAAWFAANGYVCLVLDTLQLGEVPGEHHGTYSKGRWWWISRGYTPAGIEAWNAIRGIDYLISRPDVDPKRIGVTGRSGGGATSWWAAAIDDRVAAVCPVAGITDLQNHVVDGAVEGHCDCMYFTNTERWDYDVVAALAAPRPLLVENTDTDEIFPEDGVRRIFAQVEKVYGWYGAADRASLIVGKGGHVDSEELRHPAFAFFEKHLKGVADPKVVEPERKVPIEDLKVLTPGEVIEGARNATIDESLLTKFEPPPVPATEAEWEALRAKWMGALKTEVVAGWPSVEEAGPLHVRRLDEATRAWYTVRTYEFASQVGVPLKMWVVSRAGDGGKKGLHIEVVDEETWASEVEPFLRAMTRVANDRQPGEEGGPTILGSLLKGGAKRAGPTADLGVVTVYVAPRGIGPTAWPKAKDTHVRRRFLLLGQTLDGMRAFDVRRALEAARGLDAIDGVKPVTLRARGTMAAPALLASVFEPVVNRVELESPTATVEAGPAFLNLSRVLDVPQIVALLRPREVVLRGADPASWSWPVALAETLDPGRPWLKVTGEEAPR